MANLTRFESLALPLMPAAYRFAFFILRSREDAEDAVQEAYLRAFSAFDDWRGEELRPWLLTIVRHAALKMIAARRREGNVIPLDIGPDDAAGARFGAVELADPGPRADENLIRASEQQALQQAVAELPAIYRETIVLRDIEGLSYRDIARVTETAIGTVMSRLARGRQELRRKLAPAGAKDGTYGE